MLVTTGSRSTAGTCEGGISEDMAIVSVLACDAQSAGAGLRVQLAWAFSPENPTPRVLVL